MDFGTGGTADGDFLETVESHELAKAPCQACEDAKQKTVPRTGSGRKKITRCKGCQLEHDKEVRRNYRKIAASKRRDYSEKFEEYVRENGGDKFAAREQMRHEKGNEAMGLKACKECGKEFKFYRLQEVRCYGCQSASVKARQA